jgi:uncharacterized membrane protein
LNLYKAVPEDFKQLGVWVPLLSEDRKTASINRLIAVIVPRPPVGEDRRQPASAVLPINFTASADTRQALSDAGRVVTYLLNGKEGKKLLWKYVFGGDLIHLTWSRRRKLAACRDLILRKVENAEVYVFIDELTSGEVVGPSLGLATSLAIILALLRVAELVEGQNSDAFLKKLTHQFQARLSNRAFTGKISGAGKIGEVAGITEKIAAMEAHPSIHFGVLPRGSLSGNHQNTYSVSLFEAESLADLFGWLIPLRRKWQWLNLGLMIAVVALLTSLTTNLILPNWYLIDHYFHPPPVLEKVIVASHKGAFLSEYVKGKGVEVNQTDDLSFYFLNAGEDGSAEVQVSTIGESRCQCLKTLAGNDWQSKLDRVPVRDGKAEFKFQNLTSLPEMSLTIVVRWRGRDVMAFPLALSINSGSKASAPIPTADNIQEEEER